MLTKKRIVILLGGFTLALFLFIGINVARAGRNALTFPKYWRDKAAQPVPDNAIRIVALGDSAMQAIGAARPEDGIAGRIATWQDHLL